MIGRIYDYKKVNPHSATTLQVEYWLNVDVVDAYTHHELLTNFEKACPGKTQLILRYTTSKPNPYYTMYLHVYYNLLNQTVVPLSIQCISQS